MGSLPTVSSPPVGVPTCERDEVVDSSLTVASGTSTHVGNDNETWRGCGCGAQMAVALVHHQEAMGQRSVIDFVAVSPVKD